MDQSATDETFDALRTNGLLGNPRLAYHRLASRGLTRSRNESIPFCRGEVVAFIDDDCIAPLHWAGELVHRFETMPELALLYAAVVAAPELRDGWVPEYLPVRQEYIQPRPAEVVRSMGIGANFAVRRSALSLIGPWDEYLGPGAPLGYGEDTDFGYRTLRAGLGVYTSHDPAVIHYGVRRGGDVSVLGSQYVRGMAVMFLKHVRCGDLAMLPTVMREFLSWAASGTMHLLHGRRPSGYRAALAMLQGAAASLSYGVDVQGRLYRPRHTLMRMTRCFAGG